MSPSDWFSVPCHRLQPGPIVRIAVNTAKNDSQWTLQATDAIVVDFCDFKKKVVVLQKSVVVLQISV
jgi:hypothetical protein